jgi:hypothetical protein
MSVYVSWSRQSRLPSGPAFSSRRCECQRHGAGRADPAGGAGRLGTGDRLGNRRGSRPNDREPLIVTIRLEPVSITHANLLPALADLTNVLGYAQPRKVLRMAGLSFTGIRQRNAGGGTLSSNNHVRMAGLLPATRPKKRDRCAEKRSLNSVPPFRSGSNSGWVI